MTEPTQAELCPECNTPVPRQAPGGLCPVCLLGDAVAHMGEEPVCEMVETDHSLQPGSTIDSELAADLALDFATDERVEPLRIFGDYELHAEIGHGGMGVVYRARQLRLNRSVALKMIRAGKYSSLGDIQRLQCEAEAAGGLDHPGIVPVFECGEHEGLHYFTMALVEGLTLSDRISQGPLPAREAAELMLKVTEAIAFAHARGVIHRDIKPSNILLDKQGQPRITDFGLAKQVSSESDLTTTGQILGTPAFMPPEQAQGRIAEIGAAADIYALGAVLYATLTGRPPFQAQTSVDTLRMVVEEMPLAPRLFDSTIPADLETICLKCLEKSTSRRYSSACGLADELNRFLKGEPITARPVAIARRVGRWYRRHWATATTAACFLLMIAAIAITLAVTNRQLKRELFNTEKAEAEAALSSREAQSQLWVSYLNAATAKHGSGQSGQRFEAMRAIEQALKLPIPQGHSKIELTNAAIAAICLPDMEVEFSLPHRIRTAATVDSRLTVYGVAEVASQQFHVRSVATRETIFSLPIAQWRFEYVGPKFSPDSSMLVYAKTVDGVSCLHLWKIGQSDPLANFGADAAAVTFCPDSQRCAVCGFDGRIRVFEIDSMKVVLTIDSGLKAPVVVWNPKFDQLVVMDDYHWQVVDAVNGKKINELEEPRGLLGWPTWHPAGKLLCIPTRDLGISIWDVASGKKVAPPMVGHRRGGTIAAFSPSGDHLVSNDWGNLIRLWDWRSGQQLLTIPASGVVLGFSQDGHLLADCAPERIGIIRFTERTGARAIWEHSLNSNFRYLHFVPCVNRTGRLFATKVGDDVALVDLVQNEIVARLPLGSNGPLRFGEIDGHETLWTYGVSGLWEWPIKAVEGTGTCIGPARLIADIETENVWSASRDGRLVLIPLTSGGLLYDTITRRRQHLPHPPDVRSTAVSTDGTIVATGSHSSDAAGVIVWNGETGKKIAELPVSAGNARISPDVKWLCTNTGSVRLWKIGQWNESQQVTQSMGQGLFSPDSQILAIEDLSRIRLISTKTGNEVATLSAPGKTRLVVQAFTPDGEQIITCGEDTGALHIFDLREIRLQLTELGLDWDAPSFPPRTSREQASPLLPFTVDLSSFNNLPEAKALNQTAQKHFRAGEVYQALEEWREAIRLLPENARAHNQIAWVLSTGPEELRDSSQAVEFATRAVQLEPQNTDYLNTLGVALYRGGQWRAAIERLSECVQLCSEPESHDTFFLAMAHWQLGELESSRKWLTQAVQWMDKHAPDNQELQRFAAEAKQLITP